MPHEIREFFCIVPMSNAISVQEYGILSFEQAKRLQHDSVADESVQDRRDQIHVTRGRRLHQYANLYLDARNPMMYKRRAQAELLCVFSVKHSVRELPGFVYSDHNAASRYARFLTAQQENLLPLDDIFAEYWTHPNDISR